jgi:hypothetical protein
MTRKDIISKSKVKAGGPIQRTLDELMISGFIIEETRFGNKKRDSIYRLVDEYSVFYHRFIKNQRPVPSGHWHQIAQSQSYKIWTGYAFESICLKHIDEIKKVLGISKVYTESSTFRSVQENKGIQIDLLIDRKDSAINLCECKFYDAPFEISKSYASDLQNRKSWFKQATQTRKSLFTTLITNHPIKMNKYSLDVVDVAIHVAELMN